MVTTSTATQTISHPRFSSTEITRFNEDLETCTAVEIMRWASSHFAPRLTMATGFGIEGCVLVDIIGRHELPIDVFTLDTGFFFPETYRLWGQLQERYGLTIRPVQSDLSVAKQNEIYGYGLHERDPDLCCSLRKVLPLEDALRGFDAWVTAIRRDQTAARADAPVLGYDDKFELYKVNPLVGWTERDVRAYVDKYDVPYNSLHDQGYPSIGCMPCTSRVKPGEDSRSGRWRGTKKTECGLHADTPATGRLPVVNQSYEQRNK